MAKYKLVPVANRSEDVQEYELENFVIDPTKKNIFVICIDVGSTSPVEIPDYIRNVSEIIKPAFPENVEIIFTTKRKNTHSMEGYKIYEPE